jgi:eukaryotic-like serine/threonine-protein kinase
MPNATIRRIADRYELIGQLGKGGMGTVWRATDTVLRRDVAIKEVKLPRALSGEDSDAMRHRVMREAQTAARLSHPCAVTVFDVVQEDGHTFIVMELVDSPSLQELVEREGPLDPARVAEIGLDVLSALTSAHKLGITHRDVKPANVMIPSDGRAKLADFGIASVKGDPKLTATGLILGSPSYMAPEQASKDTSGPESDLWALGGTLYYAVEGEPPFDRGQPIPTLTAVVHEEPRPMTRAGALAPVILSLLAKEPSARPSPERLSSLLADAAAGSAPEIGLPDTQPSSQAITEVADPGRASTLVDEQAAPEPELTPRATPAASPGPALAPRSARTERPWLVWLGALVVLGILAALIIPNLGENEQPADAPENAANQNDNDPASDPADASEGQGQDAVAAEGQPAAGVAPEGFELYEHESGYTIAVPEGWSTEPDGVQTRFIEPETGRYLLVEYTESPGPDALARIEDSGEDAFAAEHPSYRRLALEPTTFAGTDNAALWQYEYEGQIAYNLQFVTADGEWGFALNFQTPRSQWEESQELWETFKETFTLP